MPKLADTNDVDARAREVQLVMNVIEPDPEFQPMFLSDESHILQCCRVEEDMIATRLRSFFGPSIELKLDGTVVEFIDSIKRQIPDWPDN